MGVVGFKSYNGFFVGGSFKDLMEFYGVWGGLWWGIIFELFSWDIDNKWFLMDGICVDLLVCGKGVGIVLLEVIC